MQEDNSPDIKYAKLLLIQYCAVLTKGSFGTY